jgi:hypothetical protein
MNPPSETIRHFENSILTIAVFLTPKDPIAASLKPITISAHFDGHNVGQTAYDNAINVAMILELCCAIVESPVAPPHPIHIILDGSEEFGLSGARIYVERVSNHSHILNLDALGTGGPFVVSQKTANGSSVLHSMSRVPGAYFLTVCSFLMTSGIVSSSTDLEVFRDAGFTGAECDYLGNPAHYHTSFDRIRSSADITLAGNQIFHFVMHFEETSKDRDYVGLGIAPLVIIIDQLALMILSILTFVIVLSVVIFLIVTKRLTIIRTEVLSIVGVSFVPLIVLIILGCLIYAISSLSYCCNFTFAFASMNVLGASLFVGCVSLFHAADIARHTWQLCFTLGTSLLSVCTCFCDFALPFWWAAIWSVGYYPCLLKPWGRYIAPFFNAIALLPFLFEFSSLWVLSVRYSGSIPGIIPDLLVPLFTWLMTTVIGYAVLSCCRAEKPLTTTSEWKPLFGLTSIIFFIYLLLGSPFSNDYTILGWQQQVVYENGSSTIAFVPTMGSRTLRYLKRMITHQPHVQIEDDFVAPYFHAPAVVQRLEQYEFPTFAKWPQFEFVSVESNPSERIVQFCLFDVPEGMRSVSLLIDCPGGEDCVRDVTGVDDLVHIAHGNVNHGMILRYQPVYAPFLLNLTVAGPEVPVEVVFNWNMKTPEGIAFAALFPAYVCSQQKYRVLLDTSLVKLRYV